MKERVLTAALLIPPVLLAVFLSSFWALWALAVVALVVCYAELCRAAGLKGFGLPLLGLVLIIFALPIGSWEATSRMGGAVERHWSLLQVPGTPTGSLILLILTILGVAGVLGVIRGKRGALVAEATSFWIASPLAAMVLMKMPTEPASIFQWDTPVLLCLVPIWVGDSLAIFVGRSWGKHPLAPKISPKKTVEGGIANLIGCVAASIGLAYLIHQPLIVGIFAGTATGILGQLGDLLESAMKRSAGVKDSGNLLPGHGGLLDRIDSILLSAPAVALIVVTLGPTR